MKVGKTVVDMARKALLRAKLEVELADLGMKATAEKVERYKDLAVQGFKYGLASNIIPKTLGYKPKSPEYCSKDEFVIGGVSVLTGAMLSPVIFVVPPAAAIGVVTSPLYLATVELLSK